MMAANLNLNLAQASGLVPVLARACSEQHVRALVRFLPGMPPLVGPHVPALVGLVVAEGTLVRLVASVRALMHSNLPGPERVRNHATPC
jgi:hypothetical protein